MRESTVNIRASAAEKEAWRKQAIEAGFISNHHGLKLGDLSSWFRHLAKDSWLRDLEEEASR